MKTTGGKVWVCSEKYLELAADIKPVRRGGGRKSIRRVKVIVKTRKGACRPLSTTIDRRETVAIKSKALTPNYNRRKLVCVSV